MSRINIQATSRIIPMIYAYLNFFPVIGEDEEGEMIELDAEKVLSIPRKICSREVVKRGFMSDFLFQNISNVFHAPMEVIEIIQNFTAVQEPKKGIEITEDTREELSLDDFIFLRDGGDYTVQETGEKKHFEGKLFDPEVFDDSVKEFLRLKTRLANYFEESNTEDIFDYIPPQKTNQIFTPKWVVKKMVDMLEEENSECFDKDEQTFMDLYMKSGLYIAEIVKRLYQSEAMKKQYPR